MAGTAFLVTRRLLAAVLVFALALSGAAHWPAAASDARAPAIVIGGFIVSLCAQPGDGGDDPSNPAHHQDCDQCPPCAPATLAGAPATLQPVRLARLVEPAVAPVRTPHVASPRSPRQSQGPPTA